jgi:TolB protein
MTENENVDTRGDERVELITADTNNDGNGDNLTNLTNNSAGDLEPAWSPDGRWLAVEIKRGDQTHVGVVSKEGGTVEQLTSEEGQSWPHSWAPDGERIAFAGERGGIWNVWTVSRRTREVAQLTRFKSPSGYVRYPSWSPRGGRIVFERSIRESSVWTVRPN